MALWDGEQLAQPRALERNELVGGGSGLGASGPCSALTSFDDGGGHGQELWLGGAFDAVHEIGAGSIAAWDGANWRTTPSGDALSRNAAAPDSGFAVEALESWTPPAAARPWVFAAGGFQSAGGAPIDSIATYDGAAWSPLGAGIDGEVSVMLAAEDLGSATSSLYVGGDFLSAGGMPVARLARWDGANWHDVGGGTNGRVEALHRTDAPELGGPSLFVCGYFVTAGGVTVNSIGRFDGAQWHALGSGARMTGTSNPAWVSAVVEYDDPSTPEGLELFVGGSFGSVGGVDTLYCARWDGATRREADAGLVNIGNVRDLEPFRRTPFRSSNGSPTGADCTGVLSLDFSPWLAGANDPTLEIGLVVDAQWWYRDPASPSTTGLSNALELEIRP